MATRECDRWTISRSSEPRMSVYFSGYPWSRCCEIIMRLPKRWISGTVNILICATEDRRFGEKLLDGVSVAVAILRADLETRTIAAKLTAKTYMKGIDHSPTPYFGDSPAWMKEGASEGCIASCQASKVGDPLQPSYLGAMPAAAFGTEAITAYDHGAGSRQIYWVPAKMI